MIFINTSENKFVSHITTVIFLICVVFILSKISFSKKSTLIPDLNEIKNSEITVFHICKGRLKNYGSCFTYSDKKVLNKMKFYLSKFIPRHYANHFKTEQEYIIKIETKSKTYDFLGVIFDQYINDLFIYRFEWKKPKGNDLEYADSIGDHVRIKNFGRFLWHLNPKLIPEGENINTKCGKKGKEDGVVKK